MISPITLEKLIETIEDYKRTKEEDYNGWKCGRTNLCGANLNRAFMERENLMGVEMKGADLSEANLRGANLKGAELSGTDLSEVIF